MSRKKGVLAFDRPLQCQRMRWMPHSEWTNEHIPYVCSNQELMSCTFMQSICNALVPVLLPWLKQHVVEMMGRFLKEVIIYYVHNSRSAFPPLHSPQKNSTEGNNTLCLKPLQSWNNGTLSLPSTCKCTLQDILSKHFRSQD